MDHRIKEMDGLRGVAVMLVMALHIFNRANEFTKHPVLLAFSDMTVIGWIGVDIFFVLSGFLITSILLNSRDTSHYFRNFYVRRALRIIPLYYLTMLITFALIIPIKQPELLETIPKLIPVQIFYLQNWLGIGIIEFAKTNAYIWVTWSLAIEEQFYIIWPAIVYFMKKEVLIKFSVGYIFLSAFIRMISVILHKDSSITFHFFYYNSFSRFDELIFGGLLAILLSLPKWREKITTIAIPTFYIALCIFITTCLIDLPNLPHPNFRHLPLNILGYPTLAILTVALLTIFVTHTEDLTLRRIFRNKILTFLGKYSYAMYLFHLPVALILLDIIWWTKNRGWKMYVLYIVSSYLVTIILSFLSWHVFEKHFLNLKRYFEYE